MTADLAALRAAGALDDLDVAFAELMLRLAGTTASRELALGAALASRRVGDGHVCCVLSEVRDAPPVPGLAVPSVATWTRRLRATPVVGTPGGEARPLVLDDAGRLYLQRYFAYERRLAEALRRLAAAPCDDVDPRRITRNLNRLLPRDPRLGAEIDWQRVAAATALLRRLCVISGGPGTGKTTTVTSILALLAARPDAPPPRIALAAPTGKAAARLQQAVAEAATRLDLPADVVARMPATASTVHRLLGARPDGISFRHGPASPLPHDVVVVDEASMVDLALMAKLVDALPPHARLVLLGDRDQLASVEAGAVLGDVCGLAPGFSGEAAARLSAVTGESLSPGAGGSTSPLRDAVVVLQRSWRFDAASGIGRLARAVNAGNADGAARLLGTGAADLAWTTMVPGPELEAELGEAARRGYAAFADAVGTWVRAVETGTASPELLAAVFAGFGRFRVLCAHRAGPAGVERLGTVIENAVTGTGALPRTGVWWAGRPVMIARNDYVLRLFNGDVGITLPDPAADGALRVFFDDPLGGPPRAVAPARLPEHEPVWAMTVHKSQGSEFDELLVVLPEQESRVVTRELLYTAITRARRRVVMWGTDAVVRRAVRTPLHRSSGLCDAVWRDADDA